MSDKKSIDTKNYANTNTGSNIAQTKAFNIFK